MKAIQATLLPLLLLLISTTASQADRGYLVDNSFPRPESRAGISVDTATGAFIQDVNLFTLQGSRALPMNLYHNSMLTYRRGDVGRGWSHPYEARLVGDPLGVVSVYLNGVIGHSYRYAGPGQKYLTSPGYQSRHDVLERITLNGTDNIWRLKRLGGTTYLFLPTSEVDPLTNETVFKLLAIQDRNGFTILVSYNEGRISDIQAGSARMFHFYRPVGAPLLHYIVHGGNLRSFLKYDGQDRLSRIYDPVELEGLASLTTSVGIPSGPNGLLYSATASATDTDRLIRVRASITHAKPETLQVTLFSPSGDSVPIHAGNENLFLDDFLGENPAGNWTIKVVDAVNDGVTGTINSFRIERSKQPATWIQYNYDAYPNNRVNLAMDSMGQRYYSNIYDAQGRVSFQDDGRDDNGGWQFVYTPGALGDIYTDVYDRTPAQHRTRYRHDTRCRLKLIQNSLGKETTYVNNTTGERLSITNARGNTVQFGHGSNGNVSSITAPNLAKTQFGHDANRNLTSVEDELNNISTFTYGERNTLTGSMNALEISQTKTYREDGKLDFIFNKDVAGHGISMNYNAQGMVENTNISNQEKIEYDASGRMIRLTDGDGALNAFTYDPRGNIIEKTNDLNHSILSAYDHRGRPLSETNARGHVTQFEYDGNSNLTRLINVSLAQTTQFIYDGEDRLVRTIYPTGSSTRTEYDAVGQVFRSIDAAGNANTYTYDSVGNRTAVFGPTGAKLSEIVYNNLDLPVSATDAAGNTTLFEYDVLGQRTAQVDPEGRRTEYRIDKLGRVDEVTDPLGRKYQKFFLNDDVVDKVVAPDQNETSFGYDVLNHVESITTQGIGTTRLEYTNTGHVSRYTPPSLKAQAYDYNGAGRLVRTQHLASVLPDVLQDYDQNGNITSISTQASGGPVDSKITRTYDELDRQISNTDDEGNLVRHEYNTAGQVSKLIYPDLKEVSYGYDVAGRLTAITDWADRSTVYGWDVYNNVTSIQFPNGTTRAMIYDSIGRLLMRADYDVQGNVIVSYEYSYDSSGFVTCERQHTDPVVYEPAATNFGYDSGNRLTQMNGVTVSYDTDGNITQGPVSGASTVMSWDFRNNLDASGALNCNYDVEDRLVGWQNGAISNDFAVVQSQGGSQILVNASSTGVTTRYVYGVGLAYEETNGQIKVHHYDERGSTVALSNAAGQVSGNIAYSPFGEILTETGDTGTLFKYGGLYGVVTAPNGLISMRFRWYSPEMKRFLSLDSSLGDILLPGSINRYTYAGNNPINFNDPEGEFLSAVVGFVGGAVIGATVELVGSAINGEPVNWNDVAAAAIGGAVAGGLGGLCGPACAVAGGALGSVAEDLVGAGLNGDSVDLGGLVIGAAVGGVTGGVLAGAGNQVGKRLAKNASRRALAGVGRKGVSIAGRSGLRRGGVSIGRRGALGATTNLRRGAVSINISPALQRASKIGSAAGDGIAIGLDLTGTEDELLGLIFPDPGGNGSGPSGNAGKTVNGATSQASSGVESGGEYQHAQSYLEALGAAGLPRPDTTNQNFSF